MNDDHSDLRDGIASLRGDLREAVATLRGSIDTLAAVKSGEVDQLTKQMSDLRHDAKNTRLSVSALADRIDKYPDPDTLQATLQRLTTKLDTLATHDDMRQLENDLKAYPKPENVKAGIEMAEKNQLGLVRLTALLFGSGGLGGVVVHLLTQPAPL